MYRNLQGNLGVNRNASTPSSIDCRHFPSLGTRGHGEDRCLVYRNFYLYVHCKRSIKEMNGAGAFNMEITTNKYSLPSSNHSSCVLANDFQLLQKNCLRKQRHNQIRAPLLPITTS